MSSNSLSRTESERTESESTEDGGGVRGGAAAEKKEEAAKGLIGGLQDLMALLGKKEALEQLLIEKEKEIVFCRKYAKNVLNIDIPPYPTPQHIHQMKEQAESEK